ncbi:MAG TPA: AAA family ATPase [Streptosporangiaceae bacterium]|nr:AAA family ATPase [Streptosporangiaceae bacterium]
MTDSRRLIYVSGAPGSGKTSLAVPLAAELGYALLTKDRIKETLHDALGAPEPDLAWSRRLGGAAMELLWALAADAPAVVIEANFRPYSEYERAKLSGLATHPVEVHCTCPPELAMQRYNARATHPVHVVTTLPLEAMAEYDRPVGIGTLITVDTTVPVDVSALAAAVRDCHDQISHACADYSVWSTRTTCRQSDPPAPLLGL